MKRVIVHIGTAKSGTTSIQEFLLRNKKSLQDQGIAYLHTKDQNNARSLAMACSNIDKHDYFTMNTGLGDPGQRLRWNRAVTDSFLNRVKALSSDVDTLVLSCEGFWGRLQTLEEINRLRELLNPFCNDCTIIVYLRRQDQMFTSLYSSRLRIGGVDRKVLPSGIAQGSYYEKLRLWADAFGRSAIVVKAFDKVRIESTSLIDDFLASTKIDTAKNLEPVAPQNETLSAVAQEALLTLNIAYPSIVNGKPIRKNQLLKEFVTEAINQKAPGPGRLPTQSQAIKLAGQFAQSNERIQAEFLRGATLFSDDFSRYPPEASTVSLDENLLSLCFCKISEFETKWNQARLSLVGDPSDDQIAASLSCLDGFVPSHRTLPIDCRIV